MLPMERWVSLQVGRHVTVFTDSVMDLMLCASTNRSLRSHTFNMFFLISHISDFI